MKIPDRSDNLSAKQFEAKHNLTGFFKLLLEVDMRLNPHLYEDNGNTNNPDQGQ
jgi:hypothetical protein